MKSGRYLVAAALAVFLPGCALVGGGSAPLDTYELTAASPGETGPRRSRTQILIAEPSALKSLDSENVVIKPTAAEVQYLKGAQWADRLPKVVQARLAQAFQETGRLGGVGKPGEGLAIDFQVVTDIRAFEVRTDGPDTAVVELSVKIVNDRNGTVRAQKVFRGSAPVGGAGNPAFVMALDAAFAGVTADIVAWTLKAI